MPDTDHSLVDQHSEAIEKKTIPFFCLAYQLGTGRIGNHVGDDQTRTQAVDLEIEPAFDVRG